MLLLLRRRLLVLLLVLLLVVGVLLADVLVDGDDVVLGCHGSMLTNRTLTATRCCIGVLVGSDFPNLTSAA